MARVQPFTDDEVSARKVETLADLEDELAFAALEADADERLRLGILALLRYAFDAKTTAAFNRVLRDGEP